jgi:hypothetical protein
MEFGLSRDALKITIDVFGFKLVLNYSDWSGKDLVVNLIKLKLFNVNCSKLNIGIDYLKYHLIKHL